MDSVFVVEGIVLEGEFLVVWLDSVKNEETDGEDNDNGIVEYVSVFDVSMSSLQPWLCC